MALLERWLHHRTRWMTGQLSPALTIVLNNSSRGPYAFALCNTGCLPWNVLANSIPSLFPRNSVQKGQQLG